jgi:uncharacterized protein YutE (UPF0331/DUF86 family)
MTINGVVLRKLEIIDETVSKLRGLGSVTTAKLESDFFLKKGVERALQVCVEAVIDVSHRIISLQAHPPCSTASKALEAIAAIGVLKTADAYKPMVQFRNVVVHRYEEIDNSVLIGILEHHLIDFDQFNAEVRNYAKSQPE